MPAAKTHRPAVFAHITLTVAGRVCARVDVPVAGNAGEYIAHTLELNLAHNPTCRAAAAAVIEAIRAKKLARPAQRVRARVEGPALGFSFQHPCQGAALAFA